MLALCLLIAKYYIILEHSHVKQPATSSHSVPVLGAGEGGGCCRDSRSGFKAPVRSPRAAEAALSSGQPQGLRVSLGHIPRVTQTTRRRDTEAGGWLTHVNVRAADADTERARRSAGPKTKQAVTPGLPAQTSSGAPTHSRSGSLPIRYQGKSQNLQKNLEKKQSSKCARRK